MLAIVIPYYKISFFEVTLKSLSDQTDKRFKVYIGDDASPEDCTSLLEKYRGQFDFVYHRFENNLGSISLAKHWERCIALTTDEQWIMILGDDDVLGDNVVEDYYANLDQVFNHKINVIRFASQVIDEIGEIKTQIYVHPIKEKAETFFVRKFKGLTRSSLSEHIFLKSVFERKGFRDYPLGWQSDDAAWLDFAENKPVFAINNAIVFIRVSNLSISGKNDNKVLKNNATYQFLTTIMTSKKKLFAKKDRLNFLLSYEIQIREKITLKELFLLVKLHLLDFNFLAFLKLIRRSFINQLNR